MRPSSGTSCPSARRRLPIAKYGERWFEEGTGRAVAARPAGDRDRVRHARPARADGSAARGLARPCLTSSPRRVLRGDRHGLHVSRGEPHPAVHALPRFPLFADGHALRALVSTGIGSLWWQRRASDPSAAMRRLSVVLAALVRSTPSASRRILARAAGRPLPARVALAAGCLFPLGVCLGAFMPIGLRKLPRTTPHHEEAS